MLSYSSRRGDLWVKWHQPALDSHGKVSLADQESNESCSVPVSLKFNHAIEFEYFFFNGFSGERFVHHLQSLWLDGGIILLIPEDFHCIWASAISWELGYIFFYWNKNAVFCVLAHMTSHHQACWFIRHSQSYLLPSIGSCVTGLFYQWENTHLFIVTCVFVKLIRGTVVLWNI